MFTMMDSPTEHNANACLAGWMAGYVSDTFTEAKQRSIKIAKHVEMPLWCVNLIKKLKISTKITNFFFPVRQTESIYIHWELVHYNLMTCFQKWQHDFKGLVHTRLCCEVSETSKATNPHSSRSKLMSERTPVAAVFTSKYK